MMSLVPSLQSTNYNKEGGHTIEWNCALSPLQWMCSLRHHESRREGIIIYERISHSFIHYKIKTNKPLHSMQHGSFLKRIDLTLELPLKTPPN